MAEKRLGLFAGLGSVVVFAVITALVFSSIIQSPDAQLALAINNAYLGTTLTEIMVLFTESGREYFWVTVVGVMLVLGNRETKLLAIELALLFVIGIAAGEILKIAMYRPRPYETVDGIVRRLPTEPDSSYPSGHALIVSIGAAFSLVKFKNKVVASLLTTEASLVCYSRVYLGIHYSLDVISGISLAFGIVGVGLFILQNYLDPFLKSLRYIAVRVLQDGPLEL